MAEPKPRAISALILRSFNEHYVCFALGRALEEKGKAGYSLQCDRGSLYGGGNSEGASDSKLKLRGRGDEGGALVWEDVPEVTCS